VWRERSSELRGRAIYAENSKGCDIGYALAAASCEGANSVDACTVTAFDATTAFAVPDPDQLLAEPVGFFGSGCPADCSAEPDHPVYFGSATIYFDQPFRPSTCVILIEERELSTPVICANADFFRVKAALKNAGKMRAQKVFLPAFHDFHKCFHKMNWPNGPGRR
jgi:hypothetical protein